MERQGYKIITKNFWTKTAEIDIIAIEKEECVFIEVKTRRSTTYGTPIDAVNSNKQRHIINAAKYFIYKNSLENYNIRFDVIEVYINKKSGFINHVKRVFF